MIASVSGVLESRTAEHAVVNVSGVGFRIQASTQTLATLGALGSPVRLLTLLYVRQDHMALYGFASEEERQVFELLLTVAGIGPKVAVSILSSAPLDVLRVAIATGNADPLTRIPGIGRKTAARIVLELKGRVTAGDLGAHAAVATVADAEILAALTSLGYSTAEAQAAIKSGATEASLSIEERITAALRYFAAR